MFSLDGGGAGKIRDCGKTVLAVIFEIAGFIRPEQIGADAVFPAFRFKRFHHDASASALEPAEQKKQDFAGKRRASFGGAVAVDITPVFRKKGFLRFIRQMRQNPFPCGFVAFRHRRGGGKQEAAKTSFVKHGKIVWGFRNVIVADQKVIKRAFHSIRNGHFAFPKFHCGVSALIQKPFGEFAEFHEFILSRSAG